MIILCHVSTGWVVFPPPSMTTVSAGASPSRSVTHVVPPLTSSGHWVTMVTVRGAIHRDPMVRLDTQSPHQPQSTLMIVTSDTTFRDPVTEGSTAMEKETQYRHLCQTNQSITRVIQVLQIWQTVHQSWRANYRFSFVTVWKHAFKGWTFDCQNNRTIELLKQTIVNCCVSYFVTNLITVPDTNLWRQQFCESSRIWFIDNDMTMHDLKLDTSPWRCYQQPNTGVEQLTFVRQFMKLGHHKFVSCTVRRTST